LKDIKYDGSQRRHIEYFQQRIQTGNFGSLNEQQYQHATPGMFPFDRPFSDDQNSSGTLPVFGYREQQLPSGRTCADSFSKGFEQSKRQILANSGYAFLHDIAQEDVPSAFYNFQRPIIIEENLDSLLLEGLENWSSIQQNLYQFQLKNQTRNKQLRAQEMPASRLSSSQKTAQHPSKRQRSQKKKPKEEEDSAKTTTSGQNQTHSEFGIREDHLMKFHYYDPSVPKIKRKPRKS
jgi:uncharacterized protein YdaU (DUF1376 family)